MPAEERGDERALGFGQRGDAVGRVVALERATAGGAPRQRLDERRPLAARERPRERGVEVGERTIVALVRRRFARIERYLDADRFVLR